MKKELKMSVEMEDDEPFGPPPRMYNYHCSSCDTTSEINEVIIDVAYGQNKNRTKTSDGEVVPVFKCPKCMKRKIKCID